MHENTPREAARIAIVTGGSRGIGRAIAVRLARSGFDIWLTYHRNHEAARESCRLVESLGRTCELFAFDIGDYAATQDALAEKADQHAPEVLVFNAGITRDALMVWMTESDWISVIATNLHGFYNVTRAILFPMLREKRGRIVVISSASGQIGQAGQVNYAASKAGLIGAAKSLAREVGKKRILVNVVAPGVIATEMTEGLPAADIKPLIPLQRFGTVEEVAAVVDFLCSEKDMYIHGQVIGVNGGLAM